MKQLIQISVLSTLGLSSSTFAVNPVQGFYGGLLAEISSGPSSHTINFTRDNIGLTGTLKSNPVGGGGGLVVGYKIQKYRVEGEFLFNIINYDSLTVGSCTLLSPNVVTPVGDCPSYRFQQDALGFKGNTSVMYGLINGFFDFVTYGGDRSLVPYIGLGIGGAQVKNSREFVNTNTQAFRKNTVKSTGAAAQGILGISYYADDYTWIGMDYRYLSTNTIKDMGNQRYTLNTLNFNVNFAFDK